MGDDRFNAAAAALQGSIQSLGETVALQRARADLAEKRLRLIGKLNSHYIFRGCADVPAWRIKLILDGGSDAEEA